MKELRLILLLLIVLFISCGGNAQTYQVDDTTICTHVDNVKKTALRVLQLEEEKYIAVGIAAEAEVNNDLKDAEIARLQKEVKKYNRKIAIRKFWMPIKETSKGLLFGGVGVLIGLQLR